MIHIQRLDFVLKYSLVAIWMIVIFLLSNEGSDISSNRSVVIVQAVQNFNAGLNQELLSFLVRKLAHFITYFILGILLYNVTRSYNFKTISAVVVGIFCAAIYAVTDEIHQTYIPGRSGEVADVLLDTTASAIGIAVYILIDRKKIFTSLH